MTRKQNNLVSISKFVSLVLRHEPQRIGLRLDDAGWVSVDELLQKAAAAQQPLTRDTLLEIVASSDKQRFALSEDGLRIRANQGHSVPVELGLTPLAPPSWLYHGTASRSVPAILVEGLKRGNRHHVHLTQNPATAVSVGQRYGKPVVLRVDAQRMHQAGLAFFVSANEVWLCEAVPPEFLEVIE